MSIDILVLLEVVNKYNLDFEFPGQKHFSNKKEFLQEMGKIWDTVRDDPSIKANIQLNNMEPGV